MQPIRKWITAFVGWALPTNFLFLFLRSRRFHGEGGIESSAPLVYTLPLEELYLAKGRVVYNPAF